MTTGGPPPLPPQDPPMRGVWLLYLGLIVSVPLAGLILLVMPPPWKAVIVCVLVIFFLVLLRRLMQVSHTRRKR